MTRFLIQFKVWEGCGAEFEAAWTAMTIAIRDHEGGGLGSQLLRSPLDPTRYLALATWRSREHRNHFFENASPHPEAATRMRAVSEVVSVEVFELVTDLTINLV